MREFNGCVVIDARELKRSVLRHFKKHGKVIKIAGLTIIIFSTADVSFASSSIDDKVGGMYRKLIGIGKWVIVFKGGIDIINAIMNGDFEKVKMRFIGYLIAFGALWALPWSLDEIQNMFENEPVFTGEKK